MIKKAKAKNKPYKIADSGGLYLYVQTNGSKYWRLKYRFHGKEKVLALGVYPELSLLEARERRDQAKKLLSTKSKKKLQPKDEAKDIKSSTLIFDNKKHPLTSNQAAEAEAEAMISSNVTFGNKKHSLTSNQAPEAQELFGTIEAQKSFEQEIIGDVSGNQDGSEQFQI